jgi:hypothetical protein
LFEYERVVSHMCSHEKVFNEFYNSHAQRERF